MPRTGRPPTFDHEKQQNFLRLLAAGFAARDAARQVGVSASTVREKKRHNPAFAAAYEQAKSQAVPALLEHIHSAGPRSWRASAWLLERLRPDLFGRRVALGVDPASPRPPKERPALVVDEQMIADFLDRLRLLPDAQAFAKEKLAELEDQQRAWAAARMAYAAEIDRSGRPHDFQPGDVIPFPGSLDSIATADTAGPPDVADARNLSPGANKSSDSSPHQNAQIEPLQQQPPDVDCATLRLSGALTP